MAIITADAANSLKMSELILHAALARQLGIAVKEFCLDKSIYSNELIQVIQDCNADNNIYGILVLLPLPEHIDQKNALSFITPGKELEGLNENKTLATLFNNKQISTISSLFTLLRSVDYDLLTGRNMLVMDDEILATNAVVIKLLELIAELGISIEVIKSSDKDLQFKTLQADLLLVSLTTPDYLDDTFIKPNCIMIDFNPIVAGETFSEEKGRIVPILKSSINIESALTKAKYVAPSLGGIGPVAVATLMRNFVYNCKLAL